jgi:Fic family protein
VALILPEHTLGVETARFGPFTFQVGVDPARVETLLLRVDDAHQRFHDSPLAQVADRLEREVVVSSVFGTNSIEGGTLTEEETQLALDLAPAQVEGAEQRRAINIKAAYDLARAAAADPQWRPSVDFIRAVHAAITRDLPHEYNQPGLLRDNPKHVPTFVGDPAHGGRYKPPQFGVDVRRLLEALLDWHGELEARGLPVLVRAPLVHYYYEVVHPFWDGNGRVGRVLEATLLLREGFRYAPFAQARYYLDHIDRYFRLFNACRKAAEAGRPHPNTDFVEFFLEGLLATLNSLHGRVNDIVRVLLFATDVKRQHDAKEINARQYAIVTQVLEAGRPVPLADLRRAPWYLALYAKRTDKTRQRDLRRLREQGLLVLDKDNRLWPGFAQPEPEKA